MTILTQRRDTCRRKRVARTIDNGPHGYPWKAGFDSDLGDPSRFHIYRTRAAPIPQLSFR